MIKTITLFTGETNPRFFMLDEKISINGKETEVTVTKISIWFKKVYIYFSNGDCITFSGVSYSILR